MLLNAGKILQKTGFCLFIFLLIVFSGLSDASFIGYIHPIGGYGSLGIATGPDANLWYTACNNINVCKIGRITPTGEITNFSIGGTNSTKLNSITLGPDGNLWFTDSYGDRIGRITPDGIITLFSDGITANSSPYGITAGPDGNLWFTEYYGNKIGRITPSGVVTEFSTGITRLLSPKE